MLASLPTCQKQSRNGALKKSNGSDGTRSKDVEQENKKRTSTERERRKNMRNLYADLHALLPQLPAKVDKATIIDEAIISIKTLQLTLQKLEEKKLEMMRKSAMVKNHKSNVGPPAVMFDFKEEYLVDQGFTVASNQDLLTPHFPMCLKTWSSPNLVLSVSRNDAQISICTTKKPGLLLMLFSILEKNNIDVVTSQISSDHFKIMLMIHAHANEVRDENSEKALLALEQKYKSVAREMVTWLSS